MEATRTLRDLYAYHGWANDQVFGVCRDVDRARLEAQAAGTYGSLEETLKHLVGVEDVYLAMLHDRPIGAGGSQEEYFRSSALATREDTGMERRTFRVGEDPGTVPGAVLCRDLSLAGTRPRTTVRRGTPLVDALARLPAGFAGLEVAVVVPAPDDIAQPDASALLARRIAGPGLSLDPPHQGQVNVRATRPGLLRVRADQVARLNRSRAALLATALDGRVVEADDVVAIVKAPELFVPRERIERALVAADGEPVLRVAPFRARRVSILAGARIGPANLDVAAGRLAESLARYGAEVAGVRHLEEDDPRGIAAAYRVLLEAGAEVVLVAGSIVLDPQDPFMLAARRIGGRLVLRGAPVDPGTMFWLAYVGPVPVLGLASCELYGRVSVLDLLLPYALAGEPITRGLMAGLGYGGLLSQTQAARRPQGWGAVEAATSDEDED